MGVLGPTTGGSGGSGNAFTIIQPDSGTSPTASSSSDTLTLHSSNGSVTVSGTAGTKTIDFVDPTTTIQNTYYDGASMTGGSYISSPATFNPGSGDFSISLWFLYNGTSPRYQNLISSNDTSFASTASYFRVWGTLAADSGRVGLGSFPAGDPDLKTVVTIPIKTWTHVVVTRLSGTLSIYLNGSSSVSKVSAGSYNWSANGAIRIGNSRWDGTDGYFDGMIAEVQFYSAGLTSGNVTTLYNGGSGVYGTGSEANLLAGYHLNSTPNDYFSTNHGTWSGTAAYYTGAIVAGTGPFVWPNAYTAPPSYCGSISGAAGCERRTISGVTRYIPYF